MLYIIKNYIDLGFGNPEVDFTLSLFSDIENKQVSNHGFSSQELDFKNNDYINQKDFNFGSKNVVLTKKDVEYIYDEISENGTVIVEPESFTNIKIKNRLMFSPNINYSIKNNSHRIDYSIWIEKVNAKNFKMHNFSNKKLEISYIATSSLVKKNNLEINQNKINRLNDKIKKSLEDTVTITPRYTTSTLADDSVTISASPGAEDFDVIQYGIHNIFVSYDIAGVFDITTPTADYFSLEIPQMGWDADVYVAATNDIKVYSVFNPNNISSRSLSTININQAFPYGTLLISLKTYYFWKENDNNWYYSFVGFPDNIEYS